MDNYTISIIIPVFNGGEHIRECLTSLSLQAQERAEYIVVNDGSNDNTSQIVEEISTHDSRVRPIHLSQSGGAHRARTIGLQHATGDLIGFVDADDFVHPSMFQQLADAIVEGGADIAICGVRNVTETGRPLDERVKFKGPARLTDRLLERFAALEFGSGVLWNKLYRRELIDQAFSHPTSEVLTAGEDYLLNIGIFHVARSVHLINHPLYYCRAHASSVSRASSNARGFAKTLRAYVVALESYRHLEEPAFRCIDELFLRQLRYECYRITELSELEPFAAHLQASLGRLSQVRPQAVYMLVHTFRLFEPQTTPRQDLKAAIRLALRALSQLSGRRKDN